VSWQDSLVSQVRNSGIARSNLDFWAVVTCRNEMQYLPSFMEHHRQIGIQGFIFVDDGSTDGSAEFLRSQEDVILFEIKARYPEYKSEFRALICDESLVNKWVVFLDVDERLVYKNMETTPFASLIKQLEQAQSNAIIGLMVDGYRLERLEDPVPVSEGNLMAQEFWFDSSGYWAIHTNRASQKYWRTPRFDYFGGAQHRLFFNSPETSGTLLEKWLGQIALNFVGHPRPTGFLKWQLGKWVSKRLRSFSQKTEVTPPKQNKLPIVRWQKGLKFSGGIHRVNYELDLWRERVCLFHLKIDESFDDKVKKLAIEESHAGDSKIYKYLLSRVLETSAEERMLKWRRSKQFKDSRDFERSGFFG
jgi:glycosyltransferase involved in cell wall biosynthesis